MPSLSPPDPAGRRAAAGAPPAAPNWPDDPVERAAEAAAAGLRRPAPAGTGAALAALAGGDPDPRVRAAALGALVRLGEAALDVWLAAAADDPSVRRRAAELAPNLAASLPSPDGAAVAASLVGLLGDRDPAVVEMAAWALGELGETAVAQAAVERLAEVAGGHGDPLARESAVAALGSLGDPAGLEAVLAACHDRPAIRRRAVLALAAFDSPEVEAALRAALEDKDWQTRQAAEDLLGR